MPDNERWKAAADSAYEELVERRAEVERLREALAVFAAGTVHGQKVPPMARNYAKKVLSDG